MPTWTSTSYLLTPTSMTCPASWPEREGPLVISGVDPEDGTHYAAYITKDELAAGFADARRLSEDEES